MMRAVFSSVSAENLLSRARRDTLVEKLCMRCRIEKPVEVARVVLDANVVVRGGLPLDAGQKAFRVRGENALVVGNPFEDRRGHWKDEALRGEPASGKDVMDEITMNAPVSVDKSMRVDECERRKRRRYNGIERG